MPINIIEYNIEQIDSFSEMSYKKMVCEKVTDKSQILDISLYKNNIPTELRVIILGYFGEDEYTEKFYDNICNYIHIYMNLTNVISMPQINLDPRTFTAFIGYYFDLKFYKINSDDDDNKKVLFVINPELFYKHFKKLVRHFSPPVLMENSYPLLVPPIYL